MVNLRPVNHGNPNLLGNSKVCRIDGPLFWPIFSTKKYCWIYEVIDKREDWDKLDGLIFIFCAAALFFYKWYRVHSLQLQLSSRLFKKVFTPKTWDGKSHKKRLCINLLLISLFHDSFLVVFFPRKKKMFFL